MARDLQHVLDALLDGVVVIDLQGRVESVNPEASRILETSPDASCGRPPGRVLGEAHPVVALVDEVLATGRGAVASEQEIERRFEDDLLVDVAVTPLFDDAGVVDGAILLLRDRTIRSSLQEAVAERERLELFGRVAAGIAHEVKNPLGGIRGAGEILAARAVDSKTREAARLIVREAKRISSLVEDFMVLARGDRLRLENVNVHQILDEVLDLLRCDPIAEGIAVERLFDPSIPEIAGDRDRLSQVFLNLARNAFEAMSESGGRLTIRTRMILDHRLMTGQRIPGPTLAVELRDTGPGIDPEVMQQVATPFFTTRRSGTGLGIPIAEHWLSAHGGRLRVRSRLGEGTQVVALLPLRRTT